jgi:hypothetical protein
MEYNSGYPRSIEEAETRHWRNIDDIIGKELSSFIKTEEGLQIIEENNKLMKRLQKDARISKEASNDS